MNIYAKISAVMGLFFIALSAQSATLFNVVSNGNTITITTSSSKTVNAGIKSTGFNFINCSSDATGYCRFTVSNNQSQTLQMSGPAIQPQLTICSFGANNNTNVCENKTLSERFAYIVNYMGFSVVLCPVNSTTGAIGDCTVTIADSSFLGPMGMAINPSGTVAYVTTTHYNGGNPNTISMCPINADGSLGQCTQSIAAFKLPWFMALNAAGSMAYVPNGFSSPPVNAVSVCAVDNADGTITSCNNVSDASFNVPAGIVLNKAETLAYITNIGVGGNGVSVSLCAVNKTNGSLGACRSMPDPTFHAPTGIVLNSKETFAYVTNYQITQGTTISLCPIDTKNGGIFKPCTALSDPGFSGPMSIRLNKAGTFAYITEYTTNQVSVCPIKADGKFGACTSSSPSPSINSPGDIVLF